MDYKNNQQQDDSSIYKRQDLLDIYKNPGYKGSLRDPTLSVNQKNPMCGDNIDLDIEIKDNIVVDARFRGEACAVSVISSDLFINEVVGLSTADAKKISKQDILNLIGVDLTTSRVKCATLILEAFTKAINEYEQKK